MVLIFKITNDLTVPEGIPTPFHIPKEGFILIIKWL